MLVGKQRLFAGEAVAGGARGIAILDHQIFEVRHVKRRGIALIPMAHMKHLAERFGAVAMRGEKLRKRDRVGQPSPQAVAKVVEPGRGRS